MSTIAFDLLLIGENSVLEERGSGELWELGDISPAMIDEVCCSDVVEGNHRLFCFRKSAEFVDYADTRTFSADHENMQKYTAISPPPKLYPLFLGEVIDDPCPELKVFCEVLTYVLSVTGRKQFFDEEVLEKPVPSMGARHGIEAFVVDSLGVCYYFDPFRGGIVPTETQFDQPEFCSTIILSCIFERYQWRYRNGWVYQCIWLDLGHILSQIKMLASSLGKDVIWNFAPNLMNESIIFSPLSNEALLVVSLVSPPSTVV